MLLRNLFVAGLALVFAPAAYAICPDTSVKKLEGICLDAVCPPGTTAYMATVENKFPHQLFITYAFRRPDKAIITAGLTLQPGVTRMPLGFGPAVIPKTESAERSMGRLRILECGTDPDIIYRWRKK